MGADNIRIEPQARLAIPRTLNHWLLVDFDLVNKEKKIVRLPARTTVNQIMEKYVQEKASVEEVSPEQETMIVLISNRIRDVFDKLLSKRLLYKLERPQYDEICIEDADKKMSEIYGVNHLVRMFTEVGSFLPVCDERMMAYLTGQIQDFMKFLASNSSFFSSEDYEEVSPEYERRAEEL